MKILGDERPFTNQNYTYTMVTNAGAPVKVTEWEVYYKGRRLAENNKGIFKFGTNLGGLSLKLVGCVRNPDTGKLVEYSIVIQPLMGKPQILNIYWRDINDKEIGNREVAYLDKVTLVVKTQNIPEGDRLKVTIYEDQYVTGHGDSSRDMGSLYTKPINKYGYAYLDLQNMTLYQKKLNKLDYVNEGTHEYYARIQYYNKLNQIEDGIQLKVKNTPKQTVHPDTGNKPQVVGKTESTQKNKKGLNFTFGVFIDGTLNNMYNTEMKQKMDSMKNPAKKAPVNTTGLNERMTLADFQKIYDSHGDEKYSDSSYENDLSNPAILFKNYIKKDKEYQFSIYTEGVGTHSAPQEQGIELRKKDYKSDDLMEGPAFGMGNAGITDKVRKSINDVVKKIKINIDKGKEYPATITFDVFGFSRGAAAARHFVHVVNYHSYQVSKSEAVFDIKDEFGYSLNDSYRGVTMPPFGYLGQLLKEANFLDERTKVKVRFVGIYDTVPHHGAFQKNDIIDLGLDDVNKADYVVHMVAADEYRKNFDLVDISSVAKVSPQSGKKGGIELTYPGVHCDVGGAYVEGGENRCYRLALGYTYTDLEKEKKEFVKQGWFKEDELGIYAITDIRDMPYYGGYQLHGHKKNVSNQYSYIPLHIMRQFCTMKNVPINAEQLMEFKQFKQFKKKWMEDNIKFLNGIKEKLWNYSFNGGETITFKKEGDNEEIKKLRYNYLHWNATYGDRREAFGTWVSGKNHPNIINGKRKRNVH